MVQEHPAGSIMLIESQSLILYEQGNPQLQRHRPDSSQRDSLAFTSTLAKLETMPSQENFRVSSDQKSVEVFEHEPPASNAVNAATGKSSANLVQSVGGYEIDGSFYHDNGPTELNLIEGQKETENTDFLQLSAAGLYISEIKSSSFEISDASVRLLPQGSAEKGEIFYEAQLFHGSNKATQRFFEVGQDSKFHPIEVRKNQRPFQKNFLQPAAESAKSDVSINKESTIHEVEENLLRKTLTFKSAGVDTQYDTLNSLETKKAQNRQLQLRSEGPRPELYFSNDFLATKLERSPNRLAGPAIVEPAVELSRVSMGSINLASFVPEQLVPAVTSDADREVIHSANPRLADAIPRMVVHDRANIRTALFRSLPPDMFAAEPVSWVSVEPVGDLLDVTFTSTSREVVELMTKNQSELRASFKRLGIEGYEFTFSNGRSGSEAQKHSRQSQPWTDEIDLPQSSKTYTPGVSASGIDKRV